MDECFFFENLLYSILAQGPGVACGKKNIRKRYLNKKNVEKDNYEFIVAYNIPRLPLCPQQVSAQSLYPFDRL